MNGKAHRIRRILTGLALVVSISMLAAQSAAAFDGRSADTRAAAGSQPTGIVIDARSADTLGAATASQPTGIATDARSADTVSATTASQPTGIATDARSADTITAALGGSVSSGPVVDFRSPDARDVAVTSQPATRIVTVSSSSFDWADFGMGVGVTAGSLLLLAGLAAVAIGMSRPRRTPSTV
jgi:hypothetical protein